MNGNVSSVPRARAGGGIRDSSDVQPAPVIRRRLPRTTLLECTWRICVSRERLMRARGALTLDGQGAWGRTRRFRVLLSRAMSGNVSSVPGFRADFDVLF
jgi:hypothetical protein